MPVEIVCKRCGKPFTPSRGDILKGPSFYRYCEACRAIETFKGYDASDQEDRDDAA